jgi:hypothetical protein
MFMADPIQLDAAAALVGKSEVTLRRLIKGGKIPFHKERTPTGFIYQVDPDVVLAYYNKREADLFIAGAFEEASPATEEVVTPRVRVAVASDSGDPKEYWQKRAESYEDRFHHEVKNHAQTREDLGVWRGRAEQAQSMIVKLLPAPGEVRVEQADPLVPASQVKRTESSTLVAVLSTIIVLALLGVGGGLAYLHYLAR